jgi:hypothetical protein
MNRNISIFSLLTSMILALAGPPAHAALGGPSGIVIPYAGKLELNGALVTGSVDFRFDVINDGNPTTGICESKTLTGVLVTNGEFAVTIPAVSEACVKGQDVHLQIAVKQAGGSFVVLGKQRVTPVVGAVTSGPGDFAVTGVLSAGSATVTGALSASSVVVTSADNVTATNIADFKAQNQTQGVGIGFNTVRATGSNTNVDLNLAPKGTGTVVVNGPLKVTGTVDLPVGSISGQMLKADPIGCVTLQKSVANTGGGVKDVRVSLTDFGLGTTHTRTGGGCNCGSNNAGRLMVINNPTGADAWLCQCKDHVSGDANGETVAFVIGCRLK